jgi:CubicO group peptidase (beta-lactamase class C family)
MKDLRIPGVAIGIVKDDQIIYLRGFGIAGSQYFFQGLWR